MPYLFQGKVSDCFQVEHDWEVNILINYGESQSVIIPANTILTILALRSMHKLSSDAASAMSFKSPGLAKTLGMSFKAFGVFITDVNTARLNFIELF